MKSLSINLFSTKKLCINTLINMYGLKYCPKLSKEEGYKEKK